MSQIIAKGQDPTKHVLSLKYIFKSVDFMGLRYLLKDMLQSMHGFPLESLAMLLQFQWCLLGAMPINSILNPLKSRRTLVTDFTMYRMRPCAGKCSSQVVLVTLQHASCFPLSSFFSFFPVIRDDNLQRRLLFFLLSFPTVLEGENVILFLTLEVSYESYSAVLGYLFYFS